MAIFGKIDAATFSNNVAVTNGDATVTKNAADTVAQGDILELGGVAYVVAQVTSTTSIELHKVYAGSTNAALSGAVRRTCLLYTSPSPRDATLSRMPSSA